MHIETTLKAALVLLGTLSSSVFAADVTCTTSANPAPIRPVNSVGLSLTPQLRAAIKLGSDQDAMFYDCWDRSYWEIVEDNNYFDLRDAIKGNPTLPAANNKIRELTKKYIVFSNVTNGNSKDKMTVPLNVIPIGSTKNQSVLEYGKEYWWRVTFAVDTEDSINGGIPSIGLPVWGKPGPISMFTTRYTDNKQCLAMPVPIIYSPHSGKEVSLTPTLSILDLTNPGLGVGKACKLYKIEWQISSTRNFEPGRIGFNRFTLASDTNDLVHRIKLAQGTLKSNQTYYWRARVISKRSATQGGETKSDWNYAEFRTEENTLPRPSPIPPAPLLPPSPACRNLNPPFHVNPGDGATVSVRPTLFISSHGQSPGCIWDNTTWQVIDANSNEYVYQTGFTNNRYTIDIPVNTLKPNHAYLWRVKIRGNAQTNTGRNIDSNWSKETFFFTAP